MREMDKLKIGEVLYNLRKNKGFTQEQIAAHMNVSAAAVSKWESGTSYPDITMLPKLSSFFGVSIDHLLDHNLQITAEEETEIYRECEKVVAEGHFDEALKLCEFYIQKYPRNDMLKFSLAVLLTMSTYLLKSEKEKEEVIRKTVDIFEDVANHCSDPMIVESAILQTINGYMHFEKYDQALELLGKISNPTSDPNQLKAKILEKQGNAKEARALLQKTLIDQLMNMNATILDLAHSYYQENLSLAEKYIDLSTNILIRFEVNKSFLLGDYLYLLEFYCFHKNKEKSLETIQMVYQCFKDIVEKNSINPLNFNSWYLNELKVNEEHRFPINSANILATHLREKEYAFISDEPLYMEILKDIESFIKN